MMSKKRTITISKEIFEIINRLSRDSGYKDINEFINFVLKEIANSSYSGMESEIIDDKEAEKRLVKLVNENIDSKEYHVALYSHYVSKGNLKKAGEIELKIMERFY
tara:strand:- start:475 stop:792 length:318 start_codon:yes stop_codon:yes gene_type:complete